MKHVNLSIDSNGGVFAAHPLAKPDFGRIIRVTEVPEEITASAVRIQVERCVLIRKDTTEPFAPTIVPWSELDGKVQGSIVRY